MYIHCHRMNDEEVVRGIFGIHLDAIKLLNAFNIVLLMNNMYKTNKYRFPLVELVGVRCIGLTFFCTFCLFGSRMGK